MAQDPLSGKVIGAAIEVHRVLGPGLLEEAYQHCLARELELEGISFRRDHPLPLEYKGALLECGYRADFLVEDELIVELKSVQSLTAVHEAQLLSYMRLAEVRTGLLINFNVRMLKDGIRRFRL